jgi:hypothetical protein
VAVRAPATYLSRWDEGEQAAVHVQPDGTAAALIVVREASPLLGLVIGTADARLLDAGLDGHWRALDGSTFAGPVQALSGFGMGFVFGGPSGLGRYLPGVGFCPITTEIQDVLHIAPMDGRVMAVGKRKSGKIPLLMLPLP